MRSDRAATVARMAIVLAAALVLLVSAASVPAVRGAPASSSVTGSITGPNVLAPHGTAHLTINASGGPAFAANGTQVGNLTYYASVLGSDTTGVSIVPAQNGIVLGKPQFPLLTVGGTTETLTILVLIASVYHTQNESTNLTYTVTVVPPYVVAATIVNPGNSTVLGFSVTVNLDGSPVGTVSVPSLTPHGQYNLSFQYPTLGLSAGDHTFSISLANEHGLVTFAGGQTSFAQTFYVVGPSPNYTLWYVVGVVAFVGVLFIFMTRVAARRRGAVRK